MPVAHFFTEGEYKANMPSAATVRFQIESALARRIPSALTPAPKMIRPVVSTGIIPLDAMLEGGLPVGAVTELVGPECSGRTSVALSFLAGITQENKVCAWVDVSNALDPMSAAAAGVDLARMLWVRCGVVARNVQPQTRFTLPQKYLIPSPTKRGLHGGGCGGHPRNEVKGLSEAVSGLLRPEAIAPRCAEPQPRARKEREHFQPSYQRAVPTPQWTSPRKPWSAIEQALRATDLLLQGGGFSAIVLDMCSLTPEFASRVPLATWFRYRAAAEKAQSSILLLTQHACAKSAAELLLRLHPGDALGDEATVFTGLAHRVEVIRCRFTETHTNVVPLRKPPHQETNAHWQTRMIWAGQR